MDITPKLHLWESRRNDRLGWHDCIAELIDNSFDAGATRAVIEWRDGKFAIEDDGRGMPDITAAVQFGSHCKHGIDGVGMYGIGVKDAWAWLSHTIDIRTTRGGKTSTVKVCQSSLIQQDGRWIAPDPTVRDAQPGEVGTRITFGPLFQNRSKPQQDTFDKLAMTFMPALTSGRQILAIIRGKRQPIVPYRLAAMQETVEESFLIGDKPVSIQIGLAQEGERIQWPGFLVCFRHRVIKVSEIGTKHYNADRVIGRIVLGNGWALTPHKNDFSDHCQELEDAIYSRIEHLLRKSDELSDIVESNAIRAELEVMLNACVKGARAKESRPGGTREKQFGTVEPRDTGRRRTKARAFDSSLPGSVELSADGSAKSRRGFHLKFAPLGETVMGRCFSETSTVQLNSENPFVEAMRKAKNRPALVAVACGLLCNINDRMDCTQKLVVPRGEFSDAWGAVMATFKEMEVATDADSHRV